MENKFYALILLFLLSGVLPARSQDTLTCNARFYVSYDGNTVYFRAADSITGVQHFWSFGDGTQVGFGNYVAVTHNYSGQGSYPVIHLVQNTTTGCYDSSSQVITIGPPPGCSINFNYSHDSTRANTPYYFYAIPYLAGATQDTVSWTINDTLVGTGDSLHRFLAPGRRYNVCATLVTNLGCRSQMCQTIIVGDTVQAPPPNCSIDFYYSHDSTRANTPYYFYATPYLAGATQDTVRWTINDTLAGTGDSLQRFLAPGKRYHVCASLVTNLGCRSQICEMINGMDSVPVPPDSLHNVPPPDSIYHVPPPDTTHRDSTTNGPSDSSRNFVSSYPNPATNVVGMNVQLDRAEMIYVRVYNSMGSQVQQIVVPGVAGTNHLSLPISGLQSGIYYIQVQYGNETKRSRMQKL